MIGLAVHLMVGAALGVLFAFIAKWFQLRGSAAILAGVTYGLAVLVLMSFIGLPVAAVLFGGGTPISDMPGMVGWPTFAIEHGLFGLVLGLWFVRGSERSLTLRKQRSVARARSET